jgi:hypothetical protein
MRHPQNRLSLRRERRKDAKFFSPLSTIVIQRFPIYTWVELHHFSLTSAVVAESLSKGASVIVAYHPPVFQGLKSITLSNPLQASLLQCAAQGVSVYSPHTALDFVWGGINDWLAEGLMDGKGNGEIRSLDGDFQHSNSEGGQGRLVELNEAIGMDVLEKRIKSHLKLSQSLFLSSLCGVFRLLNHIPRWVVHG